MSVRPGQVVRARGESWTVHRHIPGAHGSLLEVRGRGAGNRGVRTVFLLPCEPIEHLPAPDAPRIVRPSRWRRVARAILSEATSSYDSLRSPVHASFAVLPFQLEPALAVVRGLASRILIADEVGLGKTIQAGLVICETRTRRPNARVLVVVPAGLREQWQTELRERFAIESTVLDSSALARYAAQNGNPWSVPGVVITSLDYVKRPEVVRALEGLIWDVLVFDEAHALAGRSDRATVASVLANRARTLVLLTATPHSGDDQAFARLAAIGTHPPSSFPLLVFRRTRLDVGLTSSRRTISLRVRPTVSESDMHSALMTYVRLVSSHADETRPAAHLAMTVLTRRACSSAWSLARSLDTRLRLLADEGSDYLHTAQVALPFAATDGDDEPVAELSAPGLEDRFEERRWLERLQQLARAAEPHQSKLAALERLLRRTREPAIVFTEYRDTLHRVADYLRDLGPVQLHGGLTPGERQAALRQFISGQARLLLATDAASEGLNLHHRCRLVINLELPWTPVRLEQRIGRVERLGQIRRVHAIHLLAYGTSEEDSVAVLLARMRHVDDVLGEMRGGSLSDLPGGSKGQDPPYTAFPHGVVGDLRAAARNEAARVERARALGARDAQPDGRPCVTVLHPRLGRTGSDWVYRLVLEDADHQPIWETLIGIHDALNVDSRGRRDLRLRLDSLDGLVEPLLTSASTRLLSSLLSARQAQLSLATQRESAIASELERQRGRLAGSLIQPGLFDRRAERAAAARNATLDEAVAQCTRRLAELTSQNQISFDRPRLAFGVIRR